MQRIMEFRQFCLLLPLDGVWKAIVQVNIDPQLIYFREAIIFIGCKSN